MSCAFRTLFGSIPDEAIQTRLPADTVVIGRNPVPAGEGFREFPADPMLFSGRTRIGAWQRMRISDKIGSQGPGAAAGPAVPGLREEEREPACIKKEGDP